MDKNNFGSYDIEPESRNQKTPKDKANKKKSNIILIVIIIVAAAVAVFAIYNIVGIKKEDLDNEKDYATLQSYTQMGQDTSQSAQGSLTGIDFSALKEQNEDICAWIYVDGTKINYPVVHKDNSYYLDHNALKNSNRGGAIFLEESNNNDFSDKNTIIYGHNMNDGSMFAILHEYEKEDFFNKNNIIEVTTPTKKYIYKVFAAYVTSDVSDTYTTSFKEGTYADYLKKMQENSTFKSDAVLDENKNIITLSTCVKGQDEKRYVVQAILQSEEDL